MTLVLTGVAWCALYLGSLFAVMAHAGGERQLAALFLLCALVGWATVRFAAAASAT